MGGSNLSNKRAKAINHGFQIEAEITSMRSWPGRGPNIYHLSVPDGAAWNAAWGSLLVTVGLTTSVYTAICSVAVSPWLSLGVVGLSTVIGASYLERHYIRFAAAVSSARAKVEGWS